jgi:hypothetical protein
MPDMRSPDTRVAPDELVDTVLAASRALVAVAARSLAAAGDEVTLPQYRALPREEHEPVIAAFRAFAAAAGELPQPGAALGWAGP